MARRRLAAFIVLDLLISLGAAGWFVVDRIRGIPDSLAQVVIPGKQEVALDQTGGHVICFEPVSVVGDKSYSEFPIVTPKFECSLISKSSGRPVTLSAVLLNKSYSWGGRRGLAIYSFDVEQPGAYELSGRRDGGKECVLAIGPDFSGKILGAVFGGLGIAFGLTGMSVLLLILALKNRAPAA